MLRDSAILSPGVRAATGKVQASQLHFLLLLRFPAEGGGFCSAGTAGGAERAQGAAESRREPQRERGAGQGAEATESGARGGDAAFPAAREMRCGGRGGARVKKGPWPRAS